MTRTSPLVRLAPLIVIGLAALVGGFFLRDMLSFDTLRDNRAALLGFRDANYLASVLAFICVYVLIVGLSLPGATIATLTGGFLFGLFPGVLFNIIAATLGATVIFLAARWGLGDRLAARMQASDGRIRQIKDGIDANLWPMLLLLRLLPLVPFFVANLIPGLVGVALLPFVVTTFFGIMPGSLILTSVGAGLGEVFELGQTPDLGLILRPAFLLPLLGLCGLIALPLLLRTFRQRRAG